MTVNHLQECSQRPGDFGALLSKSFQGSGVGVLERHDSVASRARDELVDTHGTTVIAVKFRDGVLNVGDRRATSANSILYDRADKVLPLDDYTLVAISGSYARAMEVVKYLCHSFKYYERSQLQPMSLEGRLAELSRMVAGNVASAMQGIGGFPVLSAYDLEVDEGRLFFYDGLGARFETTEFAAAGSGSEKIRGIFDYIVRSKKPFHEMSLTESLTEALILLDIASDLDSATGGYSKVLPIAKSITREGIVELSEDTIQDAMHTRYRHRH